MKKTVRAKSGHTLYIESISFESLPDNVKEFEYIKDFPELYVVKNWDKDGVVFMYLGKGHGPAPKEIVVWYSRGGFWSSYGNTFIDAINGAQEDGWMYA